jgi:hypothetical protein
VKMSSQITDRRTGAREPTGILVAKCIGGRIELRGNVLHIYKGGMFGLLVSLLGIEGGFAERIIPLAEISAVDIESPPFLPRYVRFSYQGSPSQSGRNLVDMMAENAMIMSLLDNRALYRIKARIEETMEKQSPASRHP